MKENNMYKKLPPFKWFVLQNFPFIEEDFDAITNYQLMCKIIEYLNSNINKTNELGEQVEALTNWFNNLDVQDEIDNKLDDMAESGQLAEIINEQIFTILNTQVQINTENIGLLKEEVDNLEESIINLTELVVFGDSWSDLNVTSAVWSSRVASVLNLTLHNYAVNGAGFVSPSNNLISSQVTTFTNDENVNKDNVKYIVVCGGLNDYRNEVTVENLVTGINSVITSLQSLCQNAKILYVSNCQYPYTLSQSFYWIRLHNLLSTSNSIATLNLDGTVGKPLYNTDNYFHLTENGSLFLARNIVASLTGGEIITYRNQYVYEDSDIKLVLGTQRVNDMIYISCIFVPKVENLSSKSITVPNNTLSYYGNIDIIGSIGRSYNKFVIQIGQNIINISSEDNFSQNEPYKISTIININEYITI